jgi:hypothetical protein
MKPISVFLTVIVATFISWVFLNIEPTYRGQYEAIDDCIQALKIMDATTSQDFLKTQMHVMAINYDPINLHLQQARDQKHLLTTLITSLAQHAKYPDIKQTLDDIKQTLDDYLDASWQREVLLEKLKTETSSLSVSLHFLRTKTIYFVNEAPIP